jgi:hypothetical protein
VALSVSDYLKILPSTFASTGAFDAVLDVDSLLFVDPLLLRKTRVPEFKQSYTKVEAKFKGIGKLLKHSNAVGDPFWRQAEREFLFPEVQALCIGYSGKGTGGAGMGPGLRQAVLTTGKAIIDAGNEDPEIFELMGLFQEKVGPDRISDMIARIIVDDIAAYTTRIFGRLGVETSPIRFEDITVNSVENPFSGEPVLLVPRSVLRDLPIAHSWSEISIVAQMNRELRDELNAFIGDTWQTHAIKKEDLRRLVLEHPDLLADLVAAYRDAELREYDFDRDPAGEVVWYRASKDAVASFPLALVLPANPSGDDILRLVITICEHFKQLLEANGLNSLLYDDNKPKHESAAQKLFFGIADAYCAANDIDLSREANAGRGPVDFKLSKGYSNRVVVEAKLSSNKRLLHGISCQIVEYQTAERSTVAVYLVIDVGGSRRQLDRLKKHIQVQRAAGLCLPEVIFVDARRKPSASKA